MRTGIMLCYPFEEKRLEKWGNSGFLIQPKLDGDRCRAIFDEYGKVTLLSSEENIINSVPHIVDQLESMGLANLELDGELYKHGAPHQVIHGTVARTVNLHPEYENIEYHIFDMVNEQPQLYRTSKLFGTIKETEYIKLVPTEAGNSIEDVMSNLDLCTKLGYEGVVIRHVGNYYIRKRSTAMMKFKPRKDDYYMIVGVVEEVSIHGEPKNALGALILSSETGDIFNVGSGSYLTRENRENLWKIRDILIGKIAHIKYQHLTPKHIPRFPVLVDIISTLSAT